MKGAVGLTAAFLIGCAGTVQGTYGDAGIDSLSADVQSREATVLPADSLPDGAVLPSECLSDHPARVQRQHPRSSSRLTGRRPLFRWRGGVEGRLKAVEICRDARCEEVVDRIVTAGSEATPDHDLPAGMLFWDVRYVDCGGALRPAAEPGISQATSQAWEMKVPLRGGPGGRSWASIYDQDSDGIEDLLILDRHVRSHVAYGTRDGRLQVVRGDGYPGHRATLSGVGDINGDGISDAVSNLAQAVPRPGLGRVLPAPDLSPRSLRVAYVVDAPAEIILDAHMDGTIAGVGDLNDDGYQDVLAGFDIFGVRLGADAHTPTVLPDVPRVYLYMGGPTYFTRYAGDGYEPRPPIAFRNPSGLYRADFFGTTLARLGDVNDDGFDDFAVSAGAYSSGLWQPTLLYLGGRNGPSSTPSFAFDLRRDPHEFLGCTVTSLGDSSGDGFPDYVISRINAMGESSGQAFQGGAWPPRSGVELVTRGALLCPMYAALDVNGDGHLDVITNDGPSDFALFAGTGRWFDPPRTGLRLEGVGPWPVYSTGDYNGDGFDDLAIGDAAHGRVLVYFGSPAGLPGAPSITLTGPDGFGEAVL